MFLTGRFAAQFPRGKRPTCFRGLHGAGTAAHRTADQRHEAGARSHGDGDHAERSLRHPASGLCEVRNDEQGSVDALGLGVRLGRASAARYTRDGGGTGTQEAVSKDQAEPNQASSVSSFVGGLDSGRSRFGGLGSGLPSKRSTQSIQIGTPNDVSSVSAPQWTHLSMEGASVHLDT